MGNPLANIKKLLNEREKTHGKFSDHARITQQLKFVMHSEPSFYELSHMQQESLEMIVHKIGRILAGNPNEPDHWNDISGYAELPIKFADDGTTI